MGGPGSGRPAGCHSSTRGRTNSETTIAAMRVGMLAAHMIKRDRPNACQRCGLPPKPGEPLEWYGEADEHGERHRLWLCSSCLAGPMIPLDLADFSRSGSSNLGESQEHEIGTGHCHGPDGDRALSKGRGRPRKERAKIYEGRVAEAVADDARRAARVAAPNSTPGTDGGTP